MRSCSIPFGCNIDDQEDLPLILAEINVVSLNILQARKLTEMESWFQFMKMDNMHIKDKLISRTIIHPKKSLSAP